MTKDERWLLDEKYDGVTSPQFESDKKRLASGEPLAYLIGWQPFLGLKIFLDSKPLIPRTETEWWTEELLSTMNDSSTMGLLRTAREWSGRAKRGDPRTFSRSVEQSHSPEDLPKGVNELLVLDLCAGSGAIGCAVLARVPNAEVYFGEIDPAHEQTILKNIRENNLDESRAHICIGDLFGPFGDMQFDIIAINPPYIPTTRELEKSVADYEPALALFSGNDGLDLIRKIAIDLPKHLKPDGIAYIECDTQNIATAYAIFNSFGLRTEILQDQFNYPRVVRVSNPLLNNNV